MKRSEYFKIGTLNEVIQLGKNFIELREIVQKMIYHNNTMNYDNNELYFLLGYIEQVLNE